jgi:hypothetical protein
MTSTWDDIQIPPLPPDWVDLPPAGTLVERVNGHRSKRLADLTLTRDQLADLPAPEPLIDDTLDQRTVAILAGPRGTLKSFVLISWAASIGTGRAWLGRTVHARQRALIVAAEGAEGMHRRLEAWEDAHLAVPDDALSVLRVPVNLLNPAAVAELCELVREGGYGFVAIDTIARSMTGGDENSGRDMGLVVAALYDVLAATGAHGSVVAAHHAPRADAGRPRGHTALESGVDTIYVTSGDPALMQLTRVKRKDGPCDDVVNCRLELRESSGFLADTRPGLANKADELLSVFVSAFSETGASKTELRAAADLAPATFHRSLNSLISLGILRNDGTDARPFYRLAKSPEAS